MENNKFQIQCAYDGVNTTREGVTTLKFAVPFSEIVNYLRIFPCIGKKISLSVGIRQPENTEEKFIGMCGFKQIVVKREGDAVISFMGTDFELPVLSEIIEKSIVLKIEIME